MDISSGRYQYVICRMTPGNMPASKRPRRKRVVYRPPLLTTGMCSSSIVPQEMMILACQTLGRTRFSSRLDGASKTI